MKRYGFLIGCIILVCGIMWSNLALAVVLCPAPKNCKKSFVLAKKAFSEAPDCFSCFNGCIQKDCDDIIVRIKRKANIISKDLRCDETESLIPDGSTLEVDLTYHIRFNGPCSGGIHTVPVGSFGGTFKIRKPSGSTVVTGTVDGTIGFETHVPVVEGECCNWPHDEGCLKGTVHAPGFTGCQFRATFASDRLGPPPFSNPLPCNIEEWKNWELLIDGLIQCNCP